MILFIHRWNLFYSIQSMKRRRENSLAFLSLSDFLVDSLSLSYFVIFYLPWTAGAEKTELEAWGHCCCSCPPLGQSHLSFKKQINKKKSGFFKNIFKEEVKNRKATWQFLRSTLFALKCLPGMHMLSEFPFKMYLTGT